MLSTWIGVVLIFVLFGAIVLAVVGPAPRSDTFEQTRAKKRIDILKTVREADTKALSSYGWVDKNKGVARLPIDRAMELTLAELANKKPSPANPIATPEPQPSAQAAAGVASPAPSASPQPSGTPKPTSVAGPSSEARGQPAAAINPPPAPPGTQPGASSSPAASAAPAVAKPNPAGSPQATPVQSPAGSPSPAPGKTP